MTLQMRFTCMYSDAFFRICAREDLSPPLMVGMASLSPVKLSLMWSRLFLSKSLWWALLSRVLMLEKQRRRCDILNPASFFRKVDTFRENFLHFWLVLHTSRNKYDLRSISRVSIFVFGFHVNFTLVFTHIHFWAWGPHKRAKLLHTSKLLHTNFTNENSHFIHAVAFSPRKNTQSSVTTHEVYFLLSNS